MKITFDNTTLDLTPTGTSYRVTIGEDVFDVEILRVDEESGRLDLRLVRLSVSPSVENIRYPIQISAYVSSDGAKRWVTINGQTVLLTKQSGTRKSGGGHQHAAGELTAPMPGQVRAVNVSEGETVTKGQTLLVLEAMKMEIRIQAPMDGVVKSLTVKIGQTVEREQILINVEG